MINLPRKKIAVTPIFDSDKTKGGLHIPDMAKERCDQGLVKYIGPDCEQDLKIGDYVLFSGYDGQLVKLEDEGMLIIMYESGIASILAEPPNVEVHGLYFRGVDGEYFTATYEMAVELIAKNITQQGKALNVRTVTIND